MVIGISTCQHNVYISYCDYWKWFGYIWLSCKQNFEHWNQYSPFDCTKMR